MNVFVALVAVAVLTLTPSFAMAQCGPGGFASSTGNLDSGRLNVNDGIGSIGSTSGTFRENPWPNVRGQVGGLFGDWSL